MNVDYWTERFRRQGPWYVARGGREQSYHEQAAAIGGWLTRVLRHEDDLGPVLDFGCGVGRFAPVLARHFLAYRGFDLVADAAALNPYPTTDTVPDEIEGLAAIQVFQHILDDGVLVDLGRRLRLGAMVVVVDQSPEPDPGPHMKYRTPEDVADLLGCRIVYGPDEILTHFAYLLEKDA